MFLMSQRRWLHAPVLLLAIVTSAIAQEAQLVPREVAPSPLVVSALAAEYLTPEEQAQLRVKHGTWLEEDLADPELRAQAAMIALRLNDVSLQDVAASPAMRARALLLRGSSAEAIKVIDGLDDIESTALRAHAFEQSGFTEAATMHANQAIEMFDADNDHTVDEVLGAVEAMRVRARTSGAPSRDYQRMLDLLGEARDSIDRLDPRTRIAEADLLLARANVKEAVPALHEALELNPRSAEAWYLLGRIAIDQFNFEGAEFAADRIDSLAPTDDDEPGHAHAVFLLATSAMVQEDTDFAVQVLDDLLTIEPSNPQALALRAAADAVRYQPEGTTQWLARLDEVSPGTAVGYYEVGRRLAFDRQYDEAAEMLAEAIRRRPAWPPPHIELGLLEMQTGRDDKAFDALTLAGELDPFNARAAFSLALLKELQSFNTIESEHFVLRYRPGEDEVVAAMMLEPLEEMHEQVAGRFGHEPERKTVLELMPDHKFFSIRITGMPRIHTIAACTGPLIAIEVPREGPPDKHLGLFDWLKVLRHEYTHTITLSQTRNRIPHWLTEAAAVSMEQTPRKYGSARELAKRWRQDDLFDLEEINWAFIHPKRPGDRSFAYAQGHWMVEYMNERFGDSALIRLLDEYFNGARESAAMPQALGVSREEFFEGFKEWAGEQVATWGLDPKPSLDELADRVRERDETQRELLEEAHKRRLERIAAMLAGEVGRAAESKEEKSVAENWPRLQRPPVEIDNDTLLELVEENPFHPDLLELTLRRSVGTGVEMSPELREVLERYAQVRPVDPYPHRVLARSLLDSEEPTAAIPHLMELDIRSENDNTYALELARLFRKQGKSNEAMVAAERAVRMNPYRPENRELAAAAAIEAGNLQAARRHIEALVVLEPDQPRHVRRIEAINRLLGADSEGG